MSGPIVNTYLKNFHHQRPAGGPIIPSPCPGQNQYPGLKVAPRLESYPRSITASEPIWIPKKCIFFLDFD